MIWMRERKWSMQRSRGRRKPGSFKGWREGLNGLKEGEGELVVCKAQRLGILSRAVKAIIIIS